MRTLANETLRFEALFLWVAFITTLLLLVVVPVSSTERSYKTFQFTNVSDSANFHYQGHGKNIQPSLATSFVDNGGVFAADVNNDRSTDLLVLGGDAPVLYLNQGDGRYVRDKNFPDLREKYNYATFLDYDKDGFRDLILVPQSGSILLLQNDRGTFIRDHRIETPSLEAGIGMTSGDFNRDRCPDVLVIQYGYGNETDALKQKRYRRGAQYKNLAKDNGRRNFLLEGNCGSFEVRHGKVFDRNHWSLAASFVDVNNDGYQDIHVANDFYRDSLYVNSGNGKFDHTYLGNSTDRNGMSSQIGDFNQDGFPDLFVSNIFVPQDSRLFDWNYFTVDVTANPDGHNVLINSSSSSESGVFRDYAGKYKMKRGGWGWSSSIGDFDNDFSWELIQALQNHLALRGSLSHMDFSNKNVLNFSRQYSGNSSIRWGNISRDIAAEFKFWVGYPSFWYREDTSDAHFRHIFGRRLGFDRLNARGVASLDYDRDGMLDLVFSQFNDTAELYRNTSYTSQGSHWIKVHVSDPWAGGRLKLVNEGDTKFLHLSSRTDFASQEPATYTIGLGESTELEKLTIDRFSARRTLNNISSSAWVELRNDQVTVKHNQ